jgi:3-hydroxyacyl-CoA dehydrogenase
MATVPNRLPNPDRFPDAEPYWAALAEGRLMLKRCPSCGQAHYYPRPHCPFCGAAKTDWEASSGRGSIYSYTINRGAPRPMAVAIVELAEGPRLSTAILDADVHALAIGSPVVLTTFPGEGGQPIPAFTTPEAEAARAYGKRARALTHDVRGVTAADAAPLQRAAVVGGGNMGCGIATALLAAGLPVVLIDQGDAAVAAAVQTIGRNLDAAVQRGKATADEVAARKAALTTSLRLEDVAGCDLVIEAVFEQMALKREVFAALDRHADPQAVLGTNTSGLDIDQIADATARPAAVVGLHFFSPAHVMPLLEIVRGPRTGARALAQAMQLGQRLGKTGVVVGVGKGFVGNRLMRARDEEAHRLLLEGALPQQVDGVLTEFGLPMGPYQIADMAGGIELVHRVLTEQGRPEPVLSRLVAAGRLGQKTGKGYYRYEPGKRRAIPDPEVAAMVADASAEAGITRRRITDEELRDRLILPMVNEGAKLLEEGVAARASDIDVVWQRGYGWPAWKGGPMYTADRIGLAAVHTRLLALQAQHGERFRPAALLAKLAAAGGRFIPDAD